MLAEQFFVTYDGVTDTDVPRQRSDPSGRHQATRRVATYLNKLRHQEKEI